MIKLSAKILLVLLLLLNILSVSAQDNKFFAGARFGYSLPMGQFASHEYKYGSYALLGQTFKAEAGWYFYKNIGISLSFTRGYFPMAAGYYLEDLQADTTDPSVTTIYLKSDPYEVSHYMGSLLYRLPLTQRMSIVLKGSGGICWAKTPYQFYTGQYLIGTLFHIVTPAQSRKLSFGMGATYQFKLFDHVDLLLETEYTYAVSKFTFWTNGGTTTDIRAIKMPIFRLQPGVNITF
ncbi:MAG: outer membrane beta-barrel protein [Bacteroidetes bacterium]|nr:outer membrane beta-barrel protein [Bacteroidota bacterium]